MKREPTKEEIAFARALYKLRPSSIQGFEVIDRAPTPNEVAQALADTVDKVLRRVFKVDEQQHCNHTDCMVPREFGLSLRDEVFEKMGPFKSNEEALAAMSRISEE